ncbi:uncharacterized protein F5891DRAFT_274271 [Suillus fuscotomentosus]|uniref:Uncharacterized protein n=1 Tax=Suillus fuscotomentosus TaxID=1912939 RepID=A0AAD4E7W9_9AGAM|nr:uncharacterized protein F5891DRAFT_274271 [Suillus fuscotomentosus]KAG1900946.1 hypothetical protein F5891DRAFT_274271 [Suillus fuscotomentosus]
MFYTFDRSTTRLEAFKSFKLSASSTFECPPHAFVLQNALFDVSFVPIVGVILVSSIWTFIEEWRRSLPPRVTCILACLHFLRLEKFAHTLVTSILNKPRSNMNGFFFNSAHRDSMIQSPSGARYPVYKPRHMTRSRQQRPKLARGGSVPASPTLKPDLPVCHPPSAIPSHGHQLSEFLASARGVSVYSAHVGVSILELVTHYRPTVTVTG